MGRNKIKIEKIENTRIRQITYFKRKRGLIKKAMELSVLCESKVMLCVLEKNEKITLYMSENNSINDFKDYWQNKNIAKENLDNSNVKTFKFFFSVTNFFK